MELLFILPLLLGFAVFGVFDGGDDSGNQTNNQTDSVNPDDQDIVAVGNSSSNALTCANGDDFVLGGGGSDSIKGASGYDLLLGEAGADTLLGDNGFDTLLGGSGNDLMYGGNGDDLMVGGSGDDYLIGGEGDDTLLGSSGADKLQGEQGNDLVISADNLDSVSVILKKYDLESFLSDESAELQTVLNARYDGDAVFEAPRTPSLLTRVDNALNDNAGGSADDEVFAGFGNDTIIADGSDSITGGAGSDAFEILSGGAGKAVLVRDFLPGTDKINVYVPFGTNPAISFVNGATLDDGVSVIVAGDVVAVLKGLVAANVTAGSIVVTVIPA
jgi:Ca2+-binding RTX toxin-like protein